MRGGGTRPVPLLAASRARRRSELTGKRSDPGIAIPRPTHWGAPTGCSAPSGDADLGGHMNGAAGAAEAVIAVLALTRGVLPPTANLIDPELPPGFDAVLNVARERRVNVVTSNSFGFGGTNTSLVFRRFEG